MNNNNENLFAKIFFYMKEEFLSYFGRRAPNDVFIVARGPIFFGVFFIWFFFGMFSLWGLTGKIESAAVAKGTIVVESNRKAIQHLEGGIVKKILVKDGDRVEKGQPLVILDETSAISELKQIKQKLRALQLLKLRIQTELDGKEKISLTPEIKNIFAGEKNLQRLINHENLQLESHIDAFKNEVEILERRIKQRESEKKGFQLQANAALKQIDILKEERDIKEKLFKKGYASKSSVRRIEKKIAELEGDFGEYNAKVAKVEQHIFETKLEIEKLKNEHMEAHNQKLDELNVEVSNLNEELVASKDIVDRHIIKSPQDGVITNVKYHTTGGVIAPGATIMEVVPQNDHLIIDAKIKPNDIDVVNAGLPARVKLSAFKVKKVPILHGKVKYVSPDQLTEPTTNAPYFLAEVEIDNDQLAKESDISLYPGMQAEVLIVTGSRTFFEYLIQPIQDTMRRAFREE